VSSNKQLEQPVTRRRGRAASAPFHYALAARLDSATRGRSTAALGGTMAGITPIHVRYRTPITEWIERVPNELSVDAVGLWQVVPGLRGFHLSSEQFESYLRLSVAKLVERGAIPVQGSANRGWSVRADLAGTQTVERVVEYWKALGREPEVSDIWFALPQFIADDGQ
jgi:hypothetical protein